MESRRKFKSDISNSYVQMLLEKKKRKFGGRVKRSSLLDDSNLANEVKLGGSSQTTIFEVPSALLPKRRHIQERKERREYEKPEHWITPKEELPASKEDVLKREKDNIAKRVSISQSWSRSVRILAIVNRHPSKRYSSSDSKIGPVRKSAPLE